MKYVNMQIKNVNFYNGILGCEPTLIWVGNDPNQFGYRTLI